MDAPPPARTCNGCHFWSSRPTHRANRRRHRPTVHSGRSGDGADSGGTWAASALDVNPASHSCRSLCRSASSRRALSRSIRRSCRLPTSWILVLLGTLHRNSFRWLTLGCGENPPLLADLAEGHGVDHAEHDDGHEYGRRGASSAHATRATIATTRWGAQRAVALVSHSATVGESGESLTTMTSPRGHDPLASRRRGRGHRLRTAR